MGNAIWCNIVTGTLARSVQFRLLRLVSLLAINICIFDFLLWVTPAPKQTPCTGKNPDIPYSPSAPVLHLWRGSYLLLHLCFKSTKFYREVLVYTFLHSKHFINSLHWNSCSNNIFWNARVTHSKLANKSKLDLIFFWTIILVDTSC